MHKKLVFGIFFFCVVAAHTFARILPLENDTLNYRLVGFSVPVNAKANSYVFEIAQGRINNNVDFQRSVITSRTASENRIIETVPAFGKEYTWRVSYLNKKGKLLDKSELYHFSTGYFRFLDSSYYRVKIIEKDEQHKDMLFFLDNPAALYNMKGEPVWYLEKLPGVDSESRSLRDLKPNASGTITCLTEKGIYEIDYNSHVLWSARDSGIVSGEGTEHFHHQFTKLSNGHYMVAGSKEDLVQVTSDDTALIQRDKHIVTRNGKFYKKSPLGTLIEYDAAGKIVWRWYSADYFTRQSIPFQTVRDEINTGTHMNAFYFDEQNSVIYIGFKFISRILKIRYPSGEVIRDYGNENKAPGNDGRPLFNYPHNCELSPDGQLYMFNNNLIRGMNGISYISMFREPGTDMEGLTKTWEFPCNIDNQAASGAGVGGSVYMLQDRSIFSCMGVAGRVFVVSPDKKVLFNALPQSYVEKEWRVLRQYKASIIETPQQLEQIIFHGTDTDASHK